MTLRLAFMLLGLTGAISASIAQAQSPTRRPQPGWAPTSEPCLTQPPLFQLEPPPASAAPRDWRDCTAEDIEAAIRRQCDLDEEPGMIAHGICLERRRENIARALERSTGGAPSHSTTIEEGVADDRRETTDAPVQDRDVCRRERYSRHDETGASAGVRVVCNRGDRASERARELLDALTRPD